ncbi:hypothetical protein ACFLY6_00770 [Candidatus Dependentiae bacterium]
MLSGSGVLPKKFVIIGNRSVLAACRGISDRIGDEDGLYFKHGVMEDEEFLKIGGFVYSVILSESCRWASDVVYFSKIYSDLIAELWQESPLEICELASTYCAQTLPKNVYTRTLKAIELGKFNFVGSVNKVEDLNSFDMGFLKSSEQKIVVFCVLPGKFRPFEFEVYGQLNLNTGLAVMGCDRDTFRRALTCKLRPHNTRILAFCDVTLPVRVRLENTSLDSIKKLLAHLCD